MAHHEYPQQKMTVGMWKECWNTSDVDFHNPDLNELFLKYHKRMLTRPGMRIFVPLCGKAVEMKWLVDHGYKVVGLEVAPVPCKAFFDENHIPYQVSDIGAIRGEKYESLDHKIVIYSCDFFHLTVDICGEFDGIWDSGGLNSMDVEDREAYIHRIRTVMGKGCVNLTEFVNFDKSISDVPWSMTTEDLKKGFGKGFKVEELTKETASKRYQDQGCSSVELFMITRI
ncbi:probable thiopurine S-methyltransferase [Saccostrea echinata]|uniref:probable thiopurine S-methyltransferase n=1 Tax=Saccostrea echinata TaxID=191078 RepID=UPI002A8314A1|nr:probable thiopurine S-methyltransferase [Saccostrea echinata]